MRPLILLAALLATAALLRKRRAVPVPQYDDIVGMPTWSGNSWTIGPGWYVEFAPTSRN